MVKNDYNNLIKLTNFTIKLLTKSFKIIIKFYSRKKACKKTLEVICYF